jgi:hypothetical protein
MPPFDVVYDSVSKWVTTSLPGVLVVGLLVNLLTEPLRPVLRRIFRLFPQVITIWLPRGDPDEYAATVASRNDAAFTATACALHVGYMVKWSVLVIVALIAILFRRQSPHPWATGLTFSYILWAAGTQVIWCLRVLSAIYAALDVPPSSDEPEQARAATS